MITAIKVMGTPVCWGIRPEWATATILGVPDGGQVVRRRFRARSVGVAYIRIGSELRRHYLNLTEAGELKLGSISGINRKEL